MWYIRSCKRESIHASVYTLDRKHMHDEKESVGFMLSKHVYQTCQYRRGAMPMHSELSFLQCHW